MNKEKEKERQEIDQTEREIALLFEQSALGREIKEQGGSLYSQHLVTFKHAYLEGYLNSCRTTMKHAATKRGFQRIDIALMIVMLISTVFHSITISDQTTEITRLEAEVKNLTIGE